MRVKYLRIHRDSHLDGSDRCTPVVHLRLAYLIRTRASAKVGAGASGRQFREVGAASRCTCSTAISIEMSSNASRVPLRASTARRHCRNYPLRPPGPSERCLASAPYLEPAELSPPLRPFSFSFTRSPCLSPCLPCRLSHRLRQARSHPHFPHSLSRGACLKSN